MKKVSRCIVLLLALVFIYPSYSSAQITRAGEDEEEESRGDAGDPFCYTKTVWVTVMVLPYIAVKYPTKVKICGG